MTWFKMQADWQCSPRLRAIGKQHDANAQMIAGSVYAAFLGVNARHGCEGLLEEIYADQSYVLSLCPAVNAIQFRQAVEHLVEVDMLALEDGKVRIVGYDSLTDRAVKPSTERVRRHRQLKAERVAQQRRVGGAS